MYVRRVADGSVMTFELKNNMAMAGWVFMTIWLGMLLLFTWLFVREGGFHQFNPLVETGIMLMFWLFGLGGAGYLFSVPRVRLSVSNGTVEVRERWMLRGRVERFPASGLSARVVDGKDDEGDPYFRLEIALPSGRTIVAKESHHRPTVETAFNRLMAAVA
jgi:hypothetical protein